MYWRKRTSMRRRAVRSTGCAHRCVGCENIHTTTYSRTHRPSNTLNKPVCSFSQQQPGPSPWYIAHTHTHTHTLTLTLTFYTPARWFFQQQPHPTCVCVTNTHVHTHTPILTHTLNTPARLLCQQPPPWCVCLSFAHTHTHLGAYICTHLRGHFLSSSLALLLRGPYLCECT